MAVVCGGEPQPFAMTSECFGYSVQVHTLLSSLFYFPPDTFELFYDSFLNALLITADTWFRTIFGSSFPPSPPHDQWPGFPFWSLINSVLTLHSAVALCSTGLSWLLEAMTKTTLALTLGRFAKRKHVTCNQHGDLKIWVDIQV